MKLKKMKLKEEVFFSVMCMARASSRGSNVDRSRPVKSSDATHFLGIRLFRSLK